MKEMHNYLVSFIFVIIFLPLNLVHTFWQRLLQVENCSWRIYFATAKEKMHG